MQINRIMPPRGVPTIRALIESLESSKLGLPALAMKLGDGSYWRLSYGQTQEHVRALGEALLASGVSPGDRVGLIGENRSEWILSYLAATAIGAVIVPFDILIKPEELAPIIRSSGARLVLASGSYLERLLEARRVSTAGLTQDSVAKVVLFDDPASVAPGAPWPIVGFKDLLATGRQLLAGASARYPTISVRPGDLAALIYTSGTTGEPKAVMLSHGNIMANADGVQMTTRLGPGDNWVVVLPLHHTYPTMLGMIVPLLTYGMITTVASLKSNLLIQIMRETGASCIPAVPALVERFYKGVWAGVREKPLPVRVAFRALFGLSCGLRVLGISAGRFLFRSVAAQLGVQKLRFFISGGGPISRQIIDGMQTLGLATFQGYGLTEASPVVSSTCPGRDRPGTVGLPLANVEVRLLEPDSDGNGEILVRGPSVMLGYQGRQDLTAAILDSDGWLHTGDLGAIDSDGYLTITGRIKNLIVTSGGKNIYPEEIENVLLESPYIAEAVVVGRDDPQHGEMPYAIVHPNLEALAEAHGGRAPEGDALRRLVAAEVRRMTRGLAAYKIPTGFDISLDALPKTSSQKVKRFLVKNK